MAASRIVVVGAGIGGLSAAMLLAASGCDVTVVERSAVPGGKMREIEIGGTGIDAGPTVFTMRWVFDELFAAAGGSFADAVRLIPVETLARHAWSEREQLDLHADIERSTDAIGDFAGPAAARGFRAFAAAARMTYLALERTFLTAQRPSAPALVGRMGLSGLRQFGHTNPMASMWSELGRYFADPRLRQLFGRYATYVGSSPFAAPSTLMLIAHVEQDGVWLVEGGMHRLARAMAAAAAAQGAALRYGRGVAEIAADARGRTTGVILEGGDMIPAEAVVFNGDAGALAAGLLGSAPTRAAPRLGLPDRSLSAVTFAMRAAVSGFPLVRHTVFFSGGYRDEFDAIFARRELPADPTVYVCAQDRDDRGSGPVNPDSRERVFCLVNAPAGGVGTAGAAQHLDDLWNNPLEIDRCRIRMDRRLAACGLTLTTEPSMTAVTTPSDFARLFPGSGGALYGMASHGWMASFRRPAARTRMPGLYLAGGSAHPGAGVPMAALSGRLAAESVLRDLASRRPSHPAATLGGTSTD